MIDSRSPAHDQIEGLEVDLQETLAELRRLAHGIYPAPLAELGLIGALTAAATRSATTDRDPADAIGRFPHAIESAVYYCCLEAHAERHQARGDRTRGSRSGSRVAGGELHFEVRDEGRGFDPAAAHDGVGLRNIHDRLEAVDGRLEIVSAPGRGTVVSGAVRGRLGRGSRAPAPARAPGGRAATRAGPRAPRPRPRSGLRAAASDGGYSRNGRVCRPPSPPWKEISSSNAQPSSSSGS